VRAISADSYSEWGTNVLTTQADPSALLPPQSPPSTVLELPPTIPASRILVAIGIVVILAAALLVFIVRTKKSS